jgi:ribosomal-protein-alanine N-acetyltransferase
MAVLQRIRDFIAPATYPNEIVVPARRTVYSISPLTTKHEKEIWQLNQRCFPRSETYSRATIAFLLSDAKTIAYRVVSYEGEMAGFVFLNLDPEGAGHITTICIAPEHRRRGLARLLLFHAEAALQKKEMNTVFLEVRVGNQAAQNLYKGLGYSVVQRLNAYYNNGEDAFLMVKSLN